MTSRGRAASRFAREAEEEGRGGARASYEPAAGDAEQQQQVQRGLLCGRRETDTLLSLPRVVVREFLSLAFVLPVYRSLLCGARCSETY